MQVIKNTIKVYFNNAKKVDFIMKYAYNNKKDIRCVGAGISKETGNTYLLFLSTEDFFGCIEEWNNRMVESEEILREY